MNSDLKNQIGKMSKVTFPEGKTFYIKLFIDLIVESSPEYEYFEIHSLVDSLNLDSEMQDRFNSLSHFIYQKLLDFEVMKKGEYYELMLTDFGIEVKNSGKKFSDYQKLKDNTSKQYYNNFNVFGNVKNLIQDSQINAKQIGDKIREESDNKSWWDKFSNNQLIVGIILFILVLIATYIGLMK